MLRQQKLSWYQRWRIKFDWWWNPPTKETMCGTKIKYRESSARRAAEAMERKRGVVFDAYKCRFCDGWHVGKARDV